MFDRLLLAVDLGDPGGAARTMCAALQLAQGAGAEVHVINVLPDIGMSLVSTYLSAQQQSEIHDEAKRALEAWAQDIVPPEVPVHLHLATGVIYDQIIKAADTLKADVIVVGSHRPELRDYLVGPNAARVARHATQSVLVVR